MHDIIRWAAENITACEAGIASHEAQAARYEAEAERVDFDAEAQSYMLAWAAKERHAAEATRLRLPVLRRRIEEVGG